jgi:biopolymer transport protein ExbB/TolQ
MASPALAASDPASQALSGLASVLQTPVHVLAVLLLGVLAYELGGLVMEAWRRVAPRARTVQDTAGRALADPDAAPAIARRAPGPLTERAVLDLAVAARSGDEDALENALAGYELRIQRKLDHTRMLVRAGPALGLMGTLIPLAPGLSALGDGNYKQLAGDLESAFAATVVGILVGTAAYALTLVRTRIYTEDLAALERAVAGHAPRAEPHRRVEVAVGGEAL